MKRLLVGLLLLASNAYAQRAPRGVPYEAGVPSAPLIDWINTSQLQRSSLAPVRQPLPPISVNDLRIPPKAVKEWQRSKKARNSGDLAASNEHLEKALQIYQPFFAAHFDLGGNHLRQRQYEQALTDFQTAASIDPDLPSAHNGMSIALFFLNRYAEAEDVARHALEINPDNPEYRFVLARIIVAQGHLTPEAETLLRQSEKTVPGSSLLLAQIYLNQGKVDSVVDELQQYLRTSDPTNKDAAECTIALLNGTATGTCAANKTFPVFQ